MTATELKKGRLVFVYFCILIVFCVIIGRMFFLVISGDKVKVKFAYDNSKISRRGNIIDRNEILVATDLKTKSLYISSVLVKDASDIARGLVSIFDDLNYQDLVKKIGSSKNNHHWILIRRNVTPSQEEKVMELKKAGLIFESDSVRVYPQRSILSHLVGYVDLDRKGLSGVEMQSNKELRLGDDIQLAADVRVQDILNDELQKALKKYNAKAASGIVVDVTNGEVLALSSLPSFDPNLQSDANSNERFNRATTGVYELGSIFKIFTNAQALEEGLVKTSDIYNVADPIKYGRFTISDDHPYKREMTVEEIFSHSSNIGTVQIAQKIGAKNQKDFLKKLGFLSKVEGKFPGLARTIYPKIWREINLYTISYGHGIAVTPLHIAMASAAMVNGGILYKPSFLKLDKQPKGKRVIKESTSHLMRLLLRQVALEGTGRNANVDGYEVGGKTGTAERAEKGSYNKNLTIASFVAAFPISEPRYLVYVVFDRPDYTFNTGGMVAAPVAGAVIRNIAPVLGVFPR